MYHVEVVKTPEFPFPVKIYVVHHASAIKQRVVEEWMENFILYEELGAGSSSVVYKGRRKGNLNYVAIICADKAKRPAITNHVRLSQDLDHPNIVCFYEWYETSNHLWLVVELCTGGSLESVIGHDGCLSEDVVRRFGWDLVKGLKYIHELGIIFSDLTPAKILLDGSGTLKFGNFCLSKADGETLEDFFTLLSTSEEAEEGDNKENFDNTRKILHGPPTYKAPEVLQGSETNMSSDFWALGCTLYYMYTGKPPFYSDSYTEMTEMILHQEPPTPRQTVFTAGPPSEDFQNLLKGLLNKNPDKRMGWPELLDHPFWTQVLMEGEEEEEYEERNLEEKRSCEGVGSKSLRQTRIPDPYPPGNADKFPNSHSATIHSPSDRRTDCQQAVRHTCGALVSSQELDRKMGMERGEEEAKTEDESKQTGAQMFHTLQPNKSFIQDNVSELRPKSGMDEDNTEAIFLLSSCANSRRSCSISDSPNLTPAPQTSTDTDIISCVKALLHTDFDLTVTPVMDNPKILKSPPVRFDPKTLCVPSYSVQKLHSLSDEEWTFFLLQLCSSLEEQNPSAAPSPHSTAARSRLNLLCYLCCVVGHKAVSTLIDLLRDNLKNSKIKQFLLPPLGEFLYLIASQEEKRGSPEGLWFVPAAAYTGLMRSLREGTEVKR
ncbi:hypothetical protein FQN60_016903 [Etheostoma spectabile]|uniref:Protein kinase domain-containing protein n=1 Tax=Etheostoma spectabile TaxID=54343 RepID=A0A5J5DDZ2_9PERO|nr:hypothetical protein FQN60_016903 [Etheostoma spectabile]